jgi:hypothetical protein
MRIKKFNESIIESRKITNIDEYFYDLLDDGNWTVKLIESAEISDSTTQLPRIYISSPIIQKWFPNNDPLTNWGMGSIRMGELKGFIENRKMQSISMELIMKCVDHFADSNNLEVIEFRYASTGTPPLFPVDTIIFTLK